MTQPYHSREYTPRALEALACISITNAAPFSPARKWDQPRFPATDAWPMEMQSVGTMEVYLAIRKNKIVKFEGKCTKLGNIKQGALDSGIQTHSLSSVDPSFYLAVGYVVFRVGKAHGVGYTTRETLRRENVKMLKAAVWGGAVG